MHNCQSAYMNNGQGANALYNGDIRTDSSITGADDAGYAGSHAAKIAMCQCSADVGLML